jgi:hypothetical protein
MLYPHSLLWHYLWVGPSVLLLALALLVWRWRLHRIFPAFFAYLLFEGILGLVLWVLDVAPSITPFNYWRSVVVGLVIESVVKLFVVWELFDRLVGQEPAKARLGKRLILCAGAILALLAAIAWTHAYIGPFAIMWYAQVIEQTIYMVEAGLLLFIFLFAAYFHLAWERRSFGIALGLSISACVGLAVFAISANGIKIQRYYLMDFFNMSVYHGCVVMWWYYLLSSSANPSTENSQRLTSAAALRSASVPRPVGRLVPTHLPASAS